MMDAGRMAARRWQMYREMKKRTKDGPLFRILPAVSGAESPAGCAE